MPVLEEPGLESVLLEAPPQTAGIHLPKELGKF